MTIEEYRVFALNGAQEDADRADASRRDWTRRIRISYGLNVVVIGLAALASWGTGHALIGLVFVPSLCFAIHNLKFCYESRARFVRLWLELRQERLDSLKEFGL